MDTSVWYKICGRMWAGETIQSACGRLGLNYLSVNRELNVNPQIKKLLLEISILASIRDEILEQWEKSTDSV